MKDDNFDLILAIPCNNVKEKVIWPKAESFLENFSDNLLIYDKKELEIKNASYNNKSNLLRSADIFCEEIEEHRKYELIFNDESSNITTERTPLAFGQVILYEDIITEEFIPICCYNFFAVLSKLSVKIISKKKLLANKDSSFYNHSFNIIYFVVPDINYHDLTLLLDQSHELWCNIMGNIDSQIYFKDYLKDAFGYKYFGKIYNIIFSDSNQFKAIQNDKLKLFNILASEEYKNKEKYKHQIELSESSDEYLIQPSQGKVKDFILIRKEKFFDDYNMYSSYKAFASIYSYYYVINENDKDLFYKRISPDINNANFSSEGNILFVLETEIFKITACLVSSMEINEQINNPDMVEIQNMFKHFINTRPLFEKLNYRYLGAQKEADFIYKQFRISDMIADYDQKRELLKDYCEVSSSITLNKHSKILNWIGIVFALIAGWDSLLLLSRIVIKEHALIWDNELIIPAIATLVIFVIFIINIKPVKHLKNLLRRIF
jgi:hypothetical protein